LELRVADTVSVDDDLRGQLSVVAALEHRQEAYWNRTELGGLRVEWNGMGY
jgi:hypothetical protein